MNRVSLFDVAVSFRLLNVCFREIRNRVSHVKSSFAKQVAFFREIRNLFRMIFLRFLYERISSVHPRYSFQDVIRTGQYCGSISNFFSNFMLLQVVCKSLKTSSNISQVTKKNES